MKKYLFLILCLITLKVSAQSSRLEIKNRDESDSTGIMDLYLQSGNLRQITIFNNGSEDPVKGITLNSDQGETSKNGNVFLLSPADTGEMKISVFKNKELLAETEFRVLPIPGPSYAFYLPSKNAEIEHGYRVNTHDTISVRFVIDSVYSLKCPRDINYEASVVTVVRNGNVRIPLKTDGQFQLNRLGLASGETIKLELNKYNRVNYSGRSFEFSASPEDFVILKIE
jgi:hypothetical protein